MGLLALALAVVAIGCGDQATSRSDTRSKEVLYPWLRGPSREFLIRGGDNVVQTYGREAGPAEKRQANRVIHAWMRARTVTDWEEDCKYFSRAYKRNIVPDAYRVSGKEVKTCPDALDFFGELASGDYVNTLTGPIDSLRVAGDLAYAQYHGRGRKDWIIPMDRERGEWWIGKAAPIGRNE